MAASGACGSILVAAVSLRTTRFKIPHSKIGRRKIVKVFWFGPLGGRYLQMRQRGGIQPLEIQNPPQGVFYLGRARR